MKPPLYTRARWLDGLNREQGIGSPAGKWRATLLIYKDYCCLEPIRTNSNREIQDFVPVMKRNCSLAAVLGGMLVFVGRAAEAATPAILPEQLQADWLRQEELRESPRAVQRGGEAVRREDDARGGCDGVKNGGWGFHTADEANPWWRVDLGRSMAIDRLLVFNRCDGCASRAANLLVLVSDDDRMWRQVFQNPGVVFYGHSDKKPLVVKLSGIKARYVRLQLPGKSYFHLDEVEIYPVGDRRNAALGRPATQSSVSEWSVAHGESATRPAAYSTAKAIQRGLRLAEDLGRRGVSVAAEVQRLRQIGEQLRQLPPGVPNESQQRLFLEARGAVRDLALRNPLLDFDKILFVKQRRVVFPTCPTSSMAGGRDRAAECFSSKRSRARSRKSVA